MDAQDTFGSSHIAMDAQEDTSSGFHIGFVFILNNLSLDDFDPEGDFPGALFSFLSFTFFLYLL